MRSIYNIDVVNAKTGKPLKKWEKLLNKAINKGLTLVTFIFIIGVSVSILSIFLLIIFKVLEII